MLGQKRADFSRCNDYMVLIAASGIRFLVFSYFLVADIRFS